MKISRVLATATLVAILSVDVICILVSTATTAMASGGDMCAGSYTSPLCGLGDCVTEGESCKRVGDTRACSCQIDE
jgi:hypothetical protein